MDREEADALARGRYWVITAVRLAGAAMVVVGLLIYNGNIQTDPLVGYFLIVVGLVDVFLMPMVLARKWRTPPL
jgi:hypothetical protein